MSRDVPADTGVGDGMAPRGYLARPRRGMRTNQFGPDVRCHPRADDMPEHHGTRSRREVVERRAIHGVPATRGFRSRFQGEPARQDRLRFDFHAPQFRPAAIPKEEQHPRRGVAFDEVRDPVVVTGCCETNRASDVPRGEVELQARLGPEVRVAYDETATDRAAIEPIGQDWVTEAAGYLPRQGQSLRRHD